MAFVATKLHPETSNVLYLIRGLPGSGKSTLARILQSVYHTDDWYEADMYFESGGVYRFVPSQIQDAHAWCKGKVSRAMAKESPCIIVSNTFSRQWEMDSYREMAEGCGYAVQEILLLGNFGSVHNVPAETVARMQARFEYQ